MPFPVVRHQDPDEVGMADEADAHHVPGLALEPVGGRPDRQDAVHGLAVVEPDLEGHPSRLLRDTKELVRDGEALRLRLRNPRVALRAGGVEVTAFVRADIPGDALLAPAEVVGGRDVGEEVEAELVAQVEAGLDEARRVDDERRLTVGLLRLDQAGYAAEIQEATPRIS
jgi:hypothetical protein